MLDARYRMPDTDTEDRLLHRLSRIQRPASSIGLLTAHVFETKLEINLKILAYIDI
jgi:hypothetical protein